MWIEEETYKLILNNSVNFCVDIILRHKDKLLLIKRKEEPMKGTPWPVGGRVWKGEKVADACRRKIKEEIGIDYSGPLIPIGFYEDQYTKNSFSDDTSYSTISIVWAGQLKPEDAKKIELDGSSEGYGFYSKLPKRFKVTMFSDFSDALEEWDRVIKAEK